jgi:hypothetical protein
MKLTFKENFYWEEIDNGVTRRVGDSHRHYVRLNSNCDIILKNIKILYFFYLIQFFV